MTTGPGSDPFRFVAATDLLDLAVEQIKNLERPSAMDREIVTILETLCRYLDHRAELCERRARLRSVD